MKKIIKKPHRDCLEEFSNASYACSVGSENNDRGATLKVVGGGGVWVKTPFSQLLFKFS